MSDIITEAGEFRFINRTRYSSEDIAALFLGRLSTASMLMGSPVTISQRDQRDRPSVYELGDYNPNVVWEAATQWDGQVRRNVMKANFVNPPGWAHSNNWKINFVTPDKLYQNPVEALSAMSEPEPSAPTEFVTQLMDVFDRCFGLDIRDWRRHQEVREGISGWARGQRIRILPKRENTASSPTRKARQDRSNAISSCSGMLESLYPVWRAESEVLSRFGAMTSSLQQVGESIPMSKERIKEAFATLTLLNALTNEMKTKLR
jgi:hypothetical protein